jgi:hypothetical protein
MINKYLIISLTFFIVTIAGSIIYLNSETPIPILYSPEGPIRELPIDTPEMHRPPNIHVFIHYGKITMSHAVHQKIFLKKKNLQAAIFRYYLVLFQIMKMLKFTLKNLNLTPFYKIEL